MRPGLVPGATLRRMLALVAACAQLACGGQPDTKAAAAAPAPLVAVVTAAVGDAAYDVAIHGHLSSLNTVQLRPQLSARIIAVHFHEGDTVKAGQLLFSLDAAEADAELARARAQQSQVGAQLATAQRELARARTLVAEHFVAASSVDAAQGKLDSLLAQQRGASADIAGAQLRRGYARVVAPFAGRAGALALHPGSLAQGGQSEPLVTLVQLDPIGAEFSLPEQLLPAVLAAQAATPVAVTLTAGDGSVHEGKLAFIDSTVNHDSGSIAMKAVFANAAQGLWPGAAVNLTVHAGVSRQAAALPPQAVQEGASARFVYVLDADSRLATVPVTVLRMQSSRAVVTGLSAGQRVVTEGSMEQLRSGMLVRVAALAPGLRQ